MLLPPAAAAAAAVAAAAAAAAAATAAGAWVPHPNAIVKDQYITWIYYQYSIFL